MSEYIMDPGARLEIGPGGKPYEELGACCKGCSGKSSGMSGLGWSIIGGTMSTQTPPIIAIPPGGGGVSIAVPPATGGGVSLPMILGIGAVGVGAFLLVRRMRRKKR